MNYSDHRSFAPRSRFATRVAALLALSLATHVASAATLLYHYTFDGGVGTNTGTASNGHLSLVNTGSAAVAFSAINGVSGGSLSARAGQQYNNSSNSGGAKGTLAGLGTMDAITVTFWVKFDALALQSGKNGRLFALGASDVAAANSMGLTLDGAGKLNLYVNGSDTTNMVNLGPTMAAETWYFVALTYDGSSVASNNSTVQFTATDSASALNAQLYIGTQGDQSLVRTGVKVGQGVGHNDSRGSIAFSAIEESWFANRANLQRGLNANLDDIRIYNGVLSIAELNAVSGFSSIPEPANAALLFSLVPACMVGLRRRARGTSG